jgi:hypothetical protein
MGSFQVRVRYLLLHSAPLAIAPTKRANRMIWHFKTLFAAARNTEREMPHAPEARLDDTSIQLCYVQLLARLLFVVKGFSCHQCADNTPRE